jgi:hypothetical protein
MPDAPAVPEWVVTSEETASSMAAWARERGLAYQRLGLLPRASPNLRENPELGIDGWSTSSALKRGAIDTAYRSWGPRKERPLRFSESVCSGQLPSGLAGIVAHHSSAHSRVATGDLNFTALASTTAVLVMLPEAGRVTRELAGRPKSTRLIIEVGAPKPEYGPLTRRVDLTPALGKRYRWELWTQDDEALVARVFDAEVIAALDAAPERTAVTVEGGVLVVEANGYLDDPASLDSLVRLASALARALRAVAAHELPRLAPGTALPPPAETPFRRWAREGAAGVEWPQPPGDAATATSAYQAKIRAAPRERGCSMATLAAMAALAAGVAAVLRR